MQYLTLPLLMQPAAFCHIPQQYSRLFTLSPSMGFQTFCTVWCVKQGVVQASLNSVTVTDVSLENGVCHSRFMGTEYVVVQGQCTHSVMIEAASEASSTVQSPGSGLGSPYRTPQVGHCNFEGVVLRKRVLQEP
eukprot:866218-Amphidinium_carterae.2